MRGLITTLLLGVALSADPLHAAGRPRSQAHNFPPGTYTLVSEEEEPARDTSRAEFRKEKLIASVLAFPIPFGFSGLHRIYLGSEPWVPVAYLISGGGGLGLLPLIDFIFIVTANEEEFRSYENNPNFFMWVK